MENENKMLKATIINMKKKESEELKIKIVMKQTRMEEVRERVLQMKQTPISSALDNKAQTSHTARNHYNFEEDV